MRPQANAAGAWVGLAAPDAGLEVGPNDWQWQSDGYQFWTQCAADGTFTLPPVTNRSEGALALWRDHNGRACVEQRIEELKHDLAAAGFCL